MKKLFLLTKTLLVMTLLSMASNAWATEYTTIFSMSGVTGFSGTEGTDYNGPGSYTNEGQSWTISDGYLGVISGKTVSLTGGTITGGTANVKNGHGKKGNLTLNTSTGVISIANSGSSYLFITLSSGTIQEGDVISLTGYNSDSKSSFYISNSTTKGSVKHSFSSSYTVPSGSGIIGKSSVYLWNDNGQTISSITITRPAVAPGAISFSPAAGSVAQGTSVMLTSTNATTIQYQWSSAAIGSEGDWSSAQTYSNSNKPVIPAAGSSNTVLSVKATNENGSTYGSASYTPVKMAYKTIYSLNDGIGSQTKTADKASVDGTSSLVLTDSKGRIKLTAVTGSSFQNGDAITFLGNIGNSAKKYGISYGSTTSLGTELSAAAGQPCYISGTLTLASATSDLYIGRADGSTTTMTAFAIRRLVAATSEAYSGVKIDGSAATLGTDYTVDGTTITLAEEHTFNQMPNVALVNHIVFSDASTEDQSVYVSFGNPDGVYYTGTATIDGTTYTVKAPCGDINALKVVYKSGDTTIKEESLDVTGLKVGASYTVPFRMYIEKDGALYQAGKKSTSPYYGESVTLEYNTTVTKSLSTVDLGGGTIELFEDLDDSGDNNASVRASNNSAYVNKLYTSAEDLPAGTYNFILKAQNQNRGSSVKVGDVTIFKASTKGKGSWNDIEINDVIIPVADKLTFTTTDAYTRYDDYDIIIAIRTSEATTTSINLNASGYATYSTYYDFTVSGATVYTADLEVDEESGTITCAAIDGGKVPAGAGVLLFGEGGAEVTITPTTGAAALSNNDLKGTTKDDGTLATKGDNDYYALSGDTFKEFTGDAFVHHKAYFEVEGGVVQARSMRIVFGGVTGISEAKAEAAAEKDGKFVINGQLVIKKNGKKFNANGAQLY